MSDELDRLLKFDPLDTAERMLGRDNPDSVNLGMALHISHNQRKREALEELGDTTFSNRLDRYQEIITAMGFELALELPFVAKGYGGADHDREERYFIYAHRDGLLLCFDTFCGDHVNGAKVYYNWISHNPADYWGYTSSGHFEGYVDRENPGVCGVATMMLARHCVTRSRACRVLARCCPGGSIVLGCGCCTTRTPRTPTTIMQPSPKAASRCALNGCKP